MNGKHGRICNPTPYLLYKEYSLGHHDFISCGINNAFINVLLIYEFTISYGFF